MVHILSTNPGLLLNHESREAIKKIQIEDIAMNMVVGTLVVIVLVPITNTTISDTNYNYWQTRPY